METPTFVNETNNNQEQEQTPLVITETSKQYLKTSAVWVTFLAIMDFIGVGLIILCGIFLMLTKSSMETLYPVPGLSFIAIFYFIIGIIVFFLTLYLYRFGQKTSKALLSNDSLILEQALENMKSYWKLTGILTIISIALLIILIPVLIVVGITTAGMMQPF
jgi:hypothetical protein